MLLVIASPIDAVGEDDLFTLHMTQHLLLGDIIPMCLLAGTTGPLLQPLLAHLPVNKLRVLATPYVALPIWALNLGFWFLPAVFDAAERYTVVHMVFHLSLLTAGTIMWLPVFETLPAPEWFGTGAKLGYILIVRSVGMIFANVLVWPNSPFYEPYKSGGSHYGIVAAGRSAAGGRGDAPLRLAADARRNRVAVPAHGAGERGASGTARTRAGRTSGPARSALRPLARAHGLAVLDRPRDSKCRSPRGIDPTSLACHVTGEHTRLAPECDENVRLSAATPVPARSASSQGCGRPALASGSRA